MGKYINIGNAEFESVRKDEYVDKSMLIAPTIPDKPNSSKQRYYLTPKGIVLLKQLTNE